MQVEQIMLDAGVDAVVTCDLFVERCAIHCIFLLELLLLFYRVNVLDCSAVG
jgi:hypothetical protein